MMLAYNWALSASMFRVSWIIKMRKVAIIAMTRMISITILRKGIIWYSRTVSRGSLRRFPCKDFLLLTHSQVFWSYLLVNYFRIILIMLKIGC